MNKQVIKDIIKIVTYIIILIFLLFKLDFTLLIIKKIFKLILPFLIGAALAFILNVILIKVEKLYKKIFKNKSIKIRRYICLSITLMLVSLTIFAIYKLVVPQVISSISTINNNLNNYINTISDCLNKIGISNDQIQTIKEYLSTRQEELLSYAKIGGTKTLDLVLNFASSIISIIFNIALAIIFAIYILLQKEKLLLQTKKLIYAYFSEKKVNSIIKVSKLSNKVFSNFVGGQFLEAIILGTLCFIGMLLLKIPYATVISIIIGITALIPMFGAFIGTLIGALFILVTNPYKTLPFIIYIIILQQIEGNFIYPKVVGKTVGLPGIWVVVALTIGGNLLGLLGIIISVPIVSIIYSLLSTNVNHRLKEK